MARAKKRSRLILTLIAGLMIAGALTAAFWPRPLMVDLGQVTRGPMMVTVDEDPLLMSPMVAVTSPPASLTTAVMPSTSPETKVKFAGNWSLNTTPDARSGPPLVTTIV